MKPFSTYTGGKEGNGTYQTIINTMPPHDIYIEPFLGNGAIFRKKLPAVIANIGIDISAAVSQQWDIIAKKESFFDQSYSIYNVDALQFLQQFAIIDLVLNRIDLKTLIYVDPPYPVESRKSSLPLYDYEMSYQDHERLLTSLLNLKSMVIISSYPNQLYSDVLKDWRTFTFQSATRRGMATEQLWFNYPESSQLHDYRFVGKDFRRREFISRKKSSIIKSISDCSAQEQQSIMLSILDQFSSNLKAVKP